MPPKVQNKRKVKTESTEPVKEAVKRKLYEQKSCKDFNSTITELAKTATTMKERLYKQVNEEFMTNGHKLPERSEFDQIIESIKALKDPYKELNTREKRKPSPNNHGLKTPTYMSGDMCRFVNEHAGLPKELLIDIDSKIDKGVFGRISLTKFWVHYIKKNNLKDLDDKALIIPDSAMNKLFTSKLADGTTFYQNLEKRINELKAEQKQKGSNSNAARFNKDSTGRITGLNFAALQIVVSPVFELGYTIPNQEKYLDKLNKINVFLTPEGTKEKTK